ncbi:MAG: 3-deoxy-manno-octulosonate cytidylyltransferase [Phycisphaeraceae bacterium]|nr:MAG: 3-deoxy-manno-octulosonate cytidylyltransferase [Phycisphaeraceae bacterium]
MPATAIIPARLGSTRFPRKALADETGRPMVVHVCERAALAESVERVVVATDAEEIAGAVRSHGFEAVLTGEHDNGTSRVGEAAERLGLSRLALVVNVQGDEPEIAPDVIDAAVGVVRSWSGPGESVIGTVAAPFGADEDASDPNIVKVVTTHASAGVGGRRALYFSRSLIPHRRADGAGSAPLKHVGLYCYTVGSLERFRGLAPTPLSRCEQLEQLRWLEHGLPIAVAVRKAAHHGIDTPGQYGEFVKRWRGS